MTRRQSLVACGMVLLHRDLPPVVIWYIGPATDRTDPFISWVSEVMIARHGIRLCRVHRLQGADVIATIESYGVLAPALVNHSAAEQLVRFLASPEALAHENGLVNRFALEATTSAS